MDHTRACNQSLRFTHHELTFFLTPSGLSDIPIMGIYKGIDGIDHVDFCRLPLMGFSVSDMDLFDIEPSKGLQDYNIEI